MANLPGSPTPAPDGPPPPIEPAPAAGALAAPGRIDPAGRFDRAGADDAVIHLPEDVASRQRIPLTIDPFGEHGEVVAKALVSSRALAVSNLYHGMTQVQASLRTLLATIADPMAPPQIVGILLQPDGSPAGPMQVQFTPATLGHTAPRVTVPADATGAFTLPLPSGLRLPHTSSIALVVQGATHTVTVQVPASQVGANGLAGTILLPQFVAPLPVSIMAALSALAAPAPSNAPPPGPANAPQLPVVKFGDGAECLLSFGMNSSVDRFPFGVFYRLIEPRASVVSEVKYHLLDDGRFTYLPSYKTAAGQALRPTSPGTAAPGALPSVPPGVPPAAPGEGDVTYVDRVPVEQPISVDGFRDQMMGLEPNGTFTADETRPMAGTLGLGYVLWMAQRWTFQGLALGNLVYSLPLAPGEQQQVAIFERVDTARVTESEFFTEEQALQQSATADTSTQATFNSAFNEAVHGRSAFSAESSSSSWGGSLILISGGSGSSSSSGTSSQSLEGQRNTSQQAAQTTHSAAENQASARRSAARTGMRMATASESQQVTTKVITNHNHTRALTMQYWEVQRLYDVTTAIDGLTLTVLVPLQVVRFMPPGHTARLGDPSQVNSRLKVLARYGFILKHGDVLLQALPRKYRHGLTMLLQFAADPTAGVESFGGVAEDVIQFTLQGTFVTCEDIWISAVTDRGTRVGPVRLSNTAPHLPPNQFTTREQLVEWLSSQRQSGAAIGFTGALALPSSMSRANVRGFEISRSFRQVDYTLQSAAVAELIALQAIFSGQSWLGQALESALPAATAPRTTVHVTPAELENALGGPQVYAFQAAINEIDASGSAVPSSQEQYANDSLNGLELPQQPYPVPARQLAPVLRYNDILEIEIMAEHVVRRTLTYSHAVWASMSADERAILLEAYTIGVPTGGIQDETQMVPLLNCVENRVVGFFGNSMIMPFIIPQALAQRGIDGETVHPAKIQEALLAYQTANFTPPRSTVALPTRGVLGEAVLGHCPSAEKIDLTRFWNWQDSASDTAPAIQPVELPTTTPSIAVGQTAPNSLTNLPSLINNVLTAPAPDTSLLQALSQAAASQKDFDSSLTGAQQLAGLVQNAQTTANLARADALKTTKDLNAQAMATVGNILGGIYGGNPTAGSSAAAAVTGAPQPQAQGQPQGQGQQAGSTGKAGPGATGAGGPGGGPGTGGPGGGPGTGGPGGGPGTGGPGTGGPGGGPGTGGSPGGGPTPAPGPPA